MSTYRREVDLGWWPEPDGRRARLTWVQPHGRLFLFYTNRAQIQLASVISEREAREFVATLDESDTTDAIERKAGERWPF